MFKILFTDKRWTTAETNFKENAFHIKLVIDDRYRFSCSKCHTRFINHSKRYINVKDLPIVEVPLHLIIEVFQGRCPCCGTFHTERPNFVHASRGYTLRLMKKVSKLTLKMSTSDIAEMYHLSPSSVTRIDKDIIEEQLPKVHIRDRDAILIDEKYLGPAIGFITLIIDARSGEPLYSAKGRDGECIRPFFEALKEEEKADLKYLGIDRANAYSAIATQYIPHIKICYDAYHLISNANEALNDVRNEQMKNPTEALRRRVAGAKYILLRSPENLKEAQRNRLNELIQYNQPLNEAYMLKEQFRSIFHQTTPNKAWWSLISWVQMTNNCSLERMKRFAKGIVRDYNGILNAIQNKINSGRIESLNAKIKRIQAKCCGLRDVSYLFLKLRQSFFLSRTSSSQQIW